MEASKQPKKLSEGQLLAPTVELTKKDGIWFIDTDKSWDPSDGTNNLLADLVRSHSSVSSSG